jgi:hypothetical protein
MTGSPARSESWTRVIRQALCGNSGLGADAWFPVSTHAQSARDEAAAAIAICRACPCAARAWRCRCGTGMSASTAYGAA